MSLIVGTLIAALAFNFEMLMFARVLQAVGMGLLLPLIFNTVLVIYPLEKRGGGDGIGLSGYHGRTNVWTDYRRSINRIFYIFWISLPLLVIGLLIGLKYLKNITDVTKPRIDLLSVGFGGVVFGFSKAGEEFEVGVAWL